MINPKSFFFFLLFINLGAFAEDYPANCQGKFQEVNLCLVDPRISQKIPGFPAELANCKQTKYDVQTVSTPESISGIFKEMAKNCKKIRKLKFLGHAYPGYLGAGDLSLGDIRTYLEPYSFLMVPDAQISLSGCNTGRGCLGRLYMLEMALSLLKNGGSIKGPDFYFISPIPRVIPNFSLTGKMTMLTLKKNPKNSDLEEEWSYFHQGVQISSKGKSLRTACEKEIQELYGNYEKEKTLAFKSGCAIMEIPGRAGGQLSAESLFKLFAYLDPKKRQNASPTVKTELNDVYANALMDFNALEDLIKSFKACPKTK